MLEDEGGSARLRRGLLGYRKSDVEGELLRLRLAVQQLRHALETGWRRRSELEHELEELRAEVTRLHGREEEVVSALAALGRAAVPAPPQPQPEPVGARGLFVESERKLEELRSDVTRQVDELLGVRDSLTHHLRGVLRDFADTLGRVERGDPLAAHALPALPPLEPVFEPMALRRGSLAAAPDELARLYAPRVEIDVGPFADFGALSEFERVLAGLPHVEDVYVRRFSGERALLEVATDGETQLLRALGEALPWDVEVLAADNDKLTLALAAPAPAEVG